jgi:hypothetical protein
VPLTRATTIRAFEPFEDAAEASAWLAAAGAAEEKVDTILDAGVALLGGALHAHAVAAADPHVPVLTAERAVAVRVGYGSGEETAEGAFSEALDIDVAAGGSRRRRRQEELRPQERVAAVLRGRERLDVCETLLLRARADLDADRRREAALQLRIGLEALLLELPAALDDPDHGRDIETLTKRRPTIEAAAERALTTDLSPEEEKTVRESLALAERILRRRRVLSS